MELSQVFATVMSREIKNLSLPPAVQPQKTVCGRTVGAQFIAPFRVPHASGGKRKGAMNRAPTGMVGTKPC